MKEFPESLVSRKREEGPGNSLDTENIALGEEREQVEDELVWQNRKCAQPSYTSSASLFEIK